LKKLSEEYNAVIVEDLNMKAMSQALNFGKSAYDIMNGECSWKCLNIS